MQIGTLLFILSGIILSIFPNAHARYPAGTDEGGMTLTGRVVAATAASPLSGAIVQVLENGRTVLGTTTDDLGRFRFDRLEPGEKVLKITYVGFRDHFEVVDPAEAAGAALQIEMVVEAIETTPMEIIGEQPAFYEELTGTATLLKAGTVRLINPVGTQELLEHVPGVNGFADDGIGNSRISIGIRGLNPRRSSRVLVLEDGAPIQPAIYIYPNMYYNPPAERIDRVEVIKGSAAVKYGPQTMGGVVNYVTRRPRQQPGGFVRFSGGENGYFSTFAEFGGWGNHQLQPEVQVLYKRGDGFRRNNDFNQFNGTFKLSILPGKGKSIYLKANANYEESSATYTGLTEYSFLTDPRFNPKEHDLFTLFRSALDIMYTNQISSQLTSNTKFYLSYFNRDWWRENDIFVRASDFQKGIYSPVIPQQPGDLVRIGNGSDNFGILRSFFVAGAEHAYDFQHTLGGQESRLDVGARLYWERFIDDKKIGDSPDARDGIYYKPASNEAESDTIVGQSHHYETAALAFHSTESIRIGRLIFSPGLRLEAFHQQRVDRLRGSIYQDKTTVVLLPGVGANLDIGRYSIFAGIHRGFTPPSSGTLSINDFGQNVDVGGLDVEAEKSWNKEAGVRGRSSWMAFEAAAFHIDIENLVAAARGTVFENLGQVTSWGMEFNTTIAASHWARILPDLHCTYSFLQTEIREGSIESAVLAGGITVDLAGNELPYAPRHTLTAGVSREFAGGLSIRADVRYVDGVFTDFENIEDPSNRGDTGPVGAYAVLNASAGYEMERGWRIFVSAKNLTDEIYIGSRLHSNPSQKAANLSSGILPGAGRQVTAGLSYSF